MDWHILRPFICVGHGLNCYVVRFHIRFGFFIIMTNGVERAGHVCFGFGGAPAEASSPASSVIRDTFQTFAPRGSCGLTRAFDVHKSPSGLKKGVLAIGTTGPPDTELAVISADRLRLKLRCPRR